MKATKNLADPLTAALCSAVLVLSSAASAGETIAKGRFVGQSNHKASGAVTVRKR